MVRNIPFQDIRSEQIIIMALKKCKECGKEVSTKAKTCPNCGAPVGTNEISSIYIIYVIAVLILSWSLYATFTDDDDSSTATKETGSLAQLQEQASEKFKAERSQILDDITTLFKSEQFAEALKRTSAFTSTNDNELMELHQIASHGVAKINAQAETKNILEELNKTPVANHIKNRNLYSRLVRLNPGTDKYIEKLSFYQKKLDDAAAVARRERLEAEARRDSIRYEQESSALSADGNLGTWRRASESDRLKLCNLMVRKMGLPRLTPISLKSCISATAGDGGLDQMKIAGIAASCAILITQ